jgi:hypothetical protein
MRALYGETGPIARVVAAGAGRTSRVDVNVDAHEPSEFDRHSS